MKNDSRSGKKSYLRLVDDSEGMRLSLRGVQGVTAGVPSRLLVITQEDDARTGFRLRIRKLNERQLQFDQKHTKLPRKLNTFHQDYPQYLIYFPLVFYCLHLIV